MQRRDWIAANNDCKLTSRYTYSPVCCVHAAISAVTRQRILDAAYAQFYRKGFARVGVDEVAEAAKVTKRTLYYHFDSKDELLAAVLDAQHALAMSTFHSWANRLAGDADEIVTRLFSELSKWAAKPRFS